MKQAAEHLEAIVNEMAGEGWEFFRVDSVGFVEQPGCLAGPDQGFEEHDPIGVPLLDDVDEQAGILVSRL